MSAVPDPGRRRPWRSRASLPDASPRRARLVAPRQPCRSTGLLMELEGLPQTLCMAVHPPSARVRRPRPRRGVHRASRAPEGVRGRPLGCVSACQTGVASEAVHRGPPRKQYLCSTPALSAISHLGSLASVSPRLGSTAGFRQCRPPSVGEGGLRRAPQAGGAVDLDQADDLAFAHRDPPRYPVLDDGAASAWRAGLA
jgi:hypothetical protein